MITDFIFFTIIFAVLNTLLKIYITKMHPGKLCIPINLPTWKKIPKDSKSPIYRYCMGDRDHITFHKDYIEKHELGTHTIDNFITWFIFAITPFVYLKFQYYGYGRTRTIIVEQNEFPNMDNIGVFFEKKAKMEDDAVKFETDKINNYNSKITEFNTEFDTNHI
jgi:hypothetical protein